MLNRCYHHKNYINNIIGSNVVENPKCFWSYVKLKRTDNIGVPTFKTGTKVCNSDIDKAEALNNHFFSVFGKPIRKIILLSGVSPFESIPSFSIDECGVLSQLRRLSPNTAHGPHELSPQQLKLVAEELSPALTIIFQQSYDMSSTPKDWNSAIATPIFKSYEIHCNLVDICPPSYGQHANHISSRTDHPLKYCNKNPLQINAYKYSFSLAV